MTDVDRERKLIPDAKITRVHGFAHFGDMTPRDVIRDGVVKYAMGYTGGHTQLSILIEHALIHKPKPGSYQSTLTKKGRAYLRAIMPTWCVLTSLRAALDRAEADIADLQHDLARYMTIAGEESERADAWFAALAALASLTGGGK